MILWLWNTADHVLQLKLLSAFCEIWTFDPSDAEKYNFNLNTQFCILPECVDEEPVNDVYFRCLDKGRYEIVSKIVDCLKNFGYRCDIKVLRDASSPAEDNFGLLVDKEVDYECMLDSIRKSKAVMDISKSGQCGFTVRMLEGIFYDKKIITDNTSVINEEFYDNRMIFILEKDKLTEIKQFLDGEKIPYPQEVKDYYSFEAWLKRFDRE